MTECVVCGVNPGEVCRGCHVKEERDALRAEVERLRQEASHWRERAAEALRLRNTAEVDAEETRCYLGGSEEMIAGLRAERDALRAEVERLKGLIERDRTGLAAALVRVRGVVRSYGWLPNPGEWGSYEYYERTVATLREEIGRAFADIDDTCEMALCSSGDRVTEAFHGKRADPPAHVGQWGALPHEPCRFCRQQGGVFFLVDDGPEGRSAAQHVRCDRCGRDWIADSSSA